MQEDKDKLIEGHQYDGIQELDNPLPRWWLVTFYSTIIFSVFYYGYYELMGGPSHDEQLATAMASIQAEQQQAKQTSKPVEIDVKSIMANPELMKVGQEHYATKCAACHAAQGQGLIGPNLTDKFWMHSKGDPEGLLVAIVEGFPSKGMPPWGHLIPEKDHPALVAYLVSLQGTNPPNPKAPQGEAVE